MAILPPTSPTTLIGGFSLAGCTGTPTETSIVRDRLPFQSALVPLRQLRSQALTLAKWAAASSGRRSRRSRTPSARRE